MLSSKDITLVYETLLASPGMNESVKISLNLSRKNVLLLAKVLEMGLANKEANGEQGIVGVAGKDAFADLTAVSDELLSKAGLQEMNSKLVALSVK